MGAWLTMLTQICCPLLQTMGASLNTAKDRYMFWNDDYFQKSQQLTDQQQYKGKGATAFLEAVNTDINNSRPVYDGLGHVGSACSNLANVMSTASSTYDSKMAAETPPFHMEWKIDPNVFDSWRDQLIQMTIDNTGNGGTYAEILNSILQSGSTSMSSAYNRAYQMVEAQVIQDAATYTQEYIAGNQSLHLPAYLDPKRDPDIAHNPDLAQQSRIAQQGLQQDLQHVQQGIHDYYLMAFNQLATEVDHDLTSWANEIMNEHHNFQFAIQNSENYLTSRDLFDYIGNNVDATQSTSKPITITPYKKDGKNGLLVSIGGTDLNDISYDTDIFSALQTGQGYTNPYLADVRLAIQNYMKEHPTMIGSEVTLAGYSLGGMTAQQLAQDITGGQDTNLSGYHLHVAQVITYGAPVMGAPLPHVKYNMYDATYDPVPLLSSYENPILKVLDSPLNPHPSIMSYLLPLSPVFGIALGTGIVSIGAAQMMPWDMKLHAYIDPKGQYGSQIHNINDVGNTPLGSPDIPVFSNHMHYQDSSQLNAASTATTGISAATLGPTEYFGMKNTENFYNKDLIPAQHTLSSVGNTLSSLGNAFSEIQKLDVPLL